MFDTDVDRNYLETTIRIRDGFLTDSNIKDKVSDNMSDKVNDKVSDKMGDKRKAFYFSLMKVFESSDYVTAKMMTEYCCVPDSTTRRYLNQLCNLKIMKPDGKKKGTKYYPV